MALFGRAEPEPETLTASVSVIRDGSGGDPNRGRISRRRSADADWQKDAWLAYKTVGEVRFAARYIAHGLSRVAFFVGPRPAPGQAAQQFEEKDAKKPAGQAVQAVFDKLRGRDGTFGSLVVDYGVQQFVAGESYLVGTDRGKAGEKWEFLSTSEHFRAEKEREQRRADANANPDAATEPTNAFVARCWTRDPEDRSRCDSSLRAVLDVVEALQTAQAMQTAADRSRLASAGLLLIPAEAKLPRTAADENSDAPPSLDLLTDLIEVASIAISDPSSPQAAIPVMVEMAEKYIASVTHLKFDREVDKTLSDRIEKYVQRLAQGLDIAPEKLTGTGSANHWGAWAIDEQVVQVHIAPMASQLAEDLTAAFLRPALVAAGVEDPESYAIGFDLTALVEAPSRADNAKWGYDNMLVDAETTAQAIGFSAETIPSAEEINRHVAIAVALKGSRVDGEILNADGTVADLPEPKTPPPFMPGPPQVEPGLGPDGKPVEDGAPSDAKGPPPEEPNPADAPSSAPARRGPRRAA